MMNTYLKNDWVQWKEDLTDAIQHADSQVYMYKRLYLERVCRDQLECGNVGLKACILTDYNISCVMINKEALAEYSQMEMLLGPLPQDLKSEAGMKLEFDPRDPSPFKYSNL